MLSDFVGCTCCCRNELDVEGADGSSKAYERAGLVGVEQNCATITLRPTFEVELQRHLADELGMELEEVDGKTLRVTKVMDSGLVPRWNRETPAMYSVEAGQSIIEVNGLQGDSGALLRILQGPISMHEFIGDSSKTLKFTISRNLQDNRKKEDLRDAEMLPAKIFVVTLDKAAGSLIGLDVDGSDATSLRIARVKETGIVADWNAANPDNIVQVGDWITAVNGFRGKDALLQQFCRVGKLNGELKLEIRRNTEADGPSVDL